MRTAWMSAACMFVLCITLGFAAPALGNSGKWEYIGTTDNVKVSRMQVPGSEVFAFRGEIVADIHIGKIIRVFIDSKQRKYWVDRYAEHKTLERTDRMEKYWIKFKLPFPVSDRDYVLQTDVEIDEAKKIVTANVRSIVDPRKPEDSCCVRAEAYSTYYRFESLPGEHGKEKTRMIVEVHTDPKGMLPNWLVNRIQKDWPSKTLGGLLRRAQREGQTPLPKLASWHE